MATQVRRLHENPEDPNGVGLERLSRVLERVAFLLHAGEHDLAVGLERLSRVFEREAVLLHGGEHDLAVGTERRSRVFEREAVLLHGVEHDLAVGLERLSCVLERVAFLLTKRQASFEPSSGASYSWIPALFWHFGPRAAACVLAIASSPTTFAASSASIDHSAVLVPNRMSTPAFSRKPYRTTTTPPAVPPAAFRAASADQPKSRARHLLQYYTNLRR